MIPKKLIFNYKIKLNFEAGERVQYLLDRDDLNISFTIKDVKQDGDIIIINSADIKTVSVIKNSHKDYAQDTKKGH